MGGHIDRRKYDVDVFDHVMGGVRPPVRSESDVPAEEQPDRRRRPERDRQRHRERQER